MKIETITLLLKGLNEELGEWITIAHEKDEEFDTKFDENIYFYVNDDVNFNELKVGDMIELDEDYAILDIRRLK